MDDPGTVLMLMDNVVSQKVLPKLIQMAIKAQLASEYEVVWASDSPEANEESEESGSASWMPLGDSTAFLDALEGAPDVRHAHQLASQPLPRVLTAYAKIVSFMGMSATACSLDVLDHALQLMKALVSCDAQSAPELCFVTKPTQAVQAFDFN